MTARRKRLHTSRAFCQNTAPAGTPRSRPWTSCITTRLTPRKLPGEGSEHRPPAISAPRAVAYLFADGRLYTPAKVVGTWAPLRGRLEAMNGFGYKLAGYLTLGIGVVIYAARSTWPRGTEGFHLVVIIACILITGVLLSLGNEADTPDVETEASDWTTSDKKREVSAASIAGLGVVLLLEAAFLVSRMMDRGISLPLALLRMTKLIIVGILFILIYLVQRYRRSHPYNPR